MCQTISLNWEEKKGADLKELWKSLESVKLKAKKLYISTVLLIKLYPMGIEVNNSGISINIYWNWTTK